MTRDRSLDEFLGRERADAADATADGSSEEADDEAATHEQTRQNEAGGEPTSDTPAAADGDPVADLDLPTDPAESTMAWAPDGAACEACGARVERRWRDDGRLVCPDCKEW